MPKKAPRSTVDDPSPITGKLFSFLKELKENNQREWFAINKPRYESDVLQPAIDFVAAMKPTLHKLSRYLVAEPKRSGGSVMRIYRDTRFSKDKLPYKTNVGIHFHHSIGGDIHAPGLYVHLEPGASFIGAGIWMPPAEPLLAIRQSIMEDPKRWNRIKNDSRFATRYRLGGESLKTAPRGIDPTHSCIEDLRRKSFLGVASFSDKDFAKPNTIAMLGEAFAEAKPLMKFLCDALGQPF